MKSYFQRCDRMKNFGLFSIVLALVLARSLAPPPPQSPEKLENANTQTSEEHVHISGKYGNLESSTIPEVHLTHEESLPYPLSSSSDHDAKDTIKDNLDDIDMVLDHMNPYEVLPEQPDPDAFLDSFFASFDDTYKDKTDTATGTSSTTKTNLKTLLEPPKLTGRSDAGVAVAFWSLVTQAIRFVLRKKFFVAALVVTVVTLSFGISSSTINRYLPVGKNLDKVSELLGFPRTERADDDSAGGVIPWNILGNIFGGDASDAGGESATLLETIGRIINTLANQATTSATDDAGQNIGRIDDTNNPSSIDDILLGAESTTQPPSTTTTYPPSTTPYPSSTTTTAQTQSSTTTAYYTSTTTIDYTSTTTTVSSYTSTTSIGTTTTSSYTSTTSISTTTMPSYTSTTSIGTTTTSSYVTTTVSNNIPYETTSTITYSTTTTTTSNEYDTTTATSTASTENA